MSKFIFMRVDEVAEILGVSEAYAYKLIRQLNKKLEKTGCNHLPQNQKEQPHYRNARYSLRGNAGVYKYVLQAGRKRPPVPYYQALSQARNGAREQNRRG